MALHPFWDVTAGSCATGAREPSQGREAAALSGTSCVPQVAWSSLPKTGAPFAPLTNRVSAEPKHRRVTVSHAKAVLGGLPQPTSR